MHSNSHLSVDIKEYYSKPIFSGPTVDLNDDFFIENAKAELNVRIGQSKFRKGVLKNFEFRCALSGISEPSLLIASHIIPWADNKNYRGNISNGICLYVEYDAFFDKGFISFTDNLEIILTPELSQLSKQLQNKLLALSGKKLRQPINQPLNEKYLSYHRANKLIRLYSIP